MSKLISIYSGEITDINKNHRQVGEDAGIFIGPLFFGSRKQRIEKRKQFLNSIESSRYDKTYKSFDVPIYHVYSHDEYFILKNLTYLENYKIFDHIVCTQYIDDLKVIGISGNFGNISSILGQNLLHKRYDEAKFIITAKKEKYCDILCFSSLNINNDVSFPFELYQMVHQLKPKLIIIGNTSELKIFKFPTTDIKTILIGKSNYLVYDRNKDCLFRNI